ncbi:MAG: DUF5926 family protein [Corynebacterium sp.]|uniref:DUF5926 family protein n=1 Tax=Corynebacterium sp. TaxID=1720 RepID=UPI0026DB135A|nr:DUF5926 family protein [Corynebacterium sp.]MDO5099399.1 DUF5926 family protein [Corynebacterium sp.]
MAKKKRKEKEQLPAGMSRRQAKLAARAAERAATERDPRPFRDVKSEADLIALQEFVPSATAKIDVTGVDRDVYLCTVLPGGTAAIVREGSEGGDAFVALQIGSRSHNPHRDLAFALQWLQDAAPGQQLVSVAADGTEPALVELFDVSQALDINQFNDFNWWLPEGTELSPEHAQAIKVANDNVMPSHRIDADVHGAVWWIDAGEKAYIRWVRPEDEDKVLRALARIAAKGELKLGEETKFAGVFRTHGVAVPVWDLDPTRSHTTYQDELLALDKKIVAELDNDAQLTPEERRQLQNIQSRQVTIR